MTGLRSGSEITLTEKGEPSATFTPATKPMGYGNVPRRSRSPSISSGNRALPTRPRSSSRQR